MTDFTVTHDTLRHVAQSLDTESKHLADVLAALDQRVQTLQGDWSGEARDAYAAAQRDWTAALADMQSVLGRIAQSTVQIADGYVEDDDRASKSFTHTAQG
jgi:6 kDa early secretory antigenic target